MAVPILSATVPRYMAIPAGMPPRCSITQGNKVPWVCVGWHGCAYEACPPERRRNHPATTNASLQPRQSRPGARWSENFHQIRCLDGQLAPGNAVSGDNERADFRQNARGAVPCPDYVVGARRLRLAAPCPLCPQKRPFAALPRNDALCH